MLKVSAFFLLLLTTGCGPGGIQTKADYIRDSIQLSRNESSVGARALHFRGALEGGMKGDSIFFTRSADGTRLTDLTFKGYWRCAGRLEQTLVGPDGFFEVKGGKVAAALVEPPDGGSTAWRFDLNAQIEDKKASGTFRMNINNLGCDTYLLKFTATAE